MNAAFEDLKAQLVEPPVLAAPIEKEPMLLYVAANARAISVAIVVEQQEPVVQPTTSLSPQTPH